MIQKLIFHQREFFFFFFKAFALFCSHRSIAMYSVVKRFLKRMCTRCRCARSFVWVCVKKEKGECLSSVNIKSLSQIFEHMAWSGLSGFKVLPGLNQPQPLKLEKKKLGY